jgi:hypothetical protein
MNEYLLVPTNLQAFVVEKPRDNVYDLARVPRNEDDLSGWYQGSHKKRTFSFDEEAKLDPLASGIHLHWALPAALTRSRREGIGGSRLRLMPWGDGSKVDTSGNNLVIVGVDDKPRLHIRVFDSRGNSKDTDETTPELPATAAGAIASLKQRLPDLLSRQELTPEERAQVISEVTSIVGHTPPTQPLIPNRWVVLRMWHGGGSPPGVSAKAWVLESDYVSPDPEPPKSTSDSVIPQNTPFPFFGTNPPAQLKGMQSTPYAFYGTNPPAELEKQDKRCSYVGRARAVPAGGWQEPQEEYRFALTSLGWGDPYFASYYPACKGVLGFHDTMDGVQEGDRVAYVVLGWCSDPTSDPLYADPPDTVQDCEKKLGKLGWSCANLERRSAGAPPRRTLCHGSCVGIQWPGDDVSVDTQPVGSNPTPGEPPWKVAIGRNAAEAVVALLARDEPDRNPKTLEHVLCAFQLGQATQVSSEDQLLDLLHRHSFGAVAGGTSWTVTPVAEPPEATAAASPPPLSAKVQDLLAKLNEAQQADDRNARLVEWTRFQLFACWAIWASEQGGLGTRPKKDKVGSALRELNQAIQGLTLTPLSQAVENCKANLSRALDEEARLSKDRGEKRTGFKLAETTSPPFLHPKDPFVVVQADGLVGVDRVRPQGTAGDAENPPMLECRLARELVAAVKQEYPVANDWQAEKVLRLQKFGAVGTLPLRQAALETLLFDPQSADLLFDRQSADLRQLFRDLQDSLQQSRKGSGAELTWVGKLPDPLGVTRRERVVNQPDQSYNPWLPVSLVWQATWTPAYAPGQDPNTGSGPLAGWELDRAPGGGDLVRNSRAQAHQSDVVWLDGATIVAAPTCSRLARDLNDFARAAGATQLERSKSETLSGVERTVLGQSLGGFNDLLLRQTLGLCLPPFDPNEDGAKVETDVWTALKQKPPPLLPLVPARPPAANTFLPVRAGALKLVNLHVVDCFGQTQRPIESDPRSPQPKVVASATLPPETEHHVAFSPRLVQPARLNFAWQPGGEESVGPVCGWIVANYLEKSFAVFSASGKPLGALESKQPALQGKIDNPADKKNKTKFQWRPTPGSSLKVAEIKNPALQRFVILAENLSLVDGDALLELLERVLMRTEGRVPAEDPAVSVLLGRPLALAQASLGLELDGPPAGYWWIDGKELKFATGDWWKLKVPVRLGGMNLPSDGLVGYLTETDPTSFCAGAGALDTRPKGSGPAIRYGQVLNVSFAARPEDLTVSFAARPDGKPVLVTLLMDAGARVHATTGLLPRHQVSLPAEAARYAALIEEFYVGVAPVLGERPRRVGGQPTITMPRPSDAFGQWSWATRPDIASWNEIRPADDRARFADGLALAEGQLRLKVKPGATARN